MACLQAAARDAATGAIEVVNQAEMFLRALASGEITVPEVIAQVQAALFPQRASPHQAGAEAEAEGAAGTAASS